MTDETKDKIKTGLVFLFFPIIGLYHLCSEYKYSNFDYFATARGLYLFMLFCWVSVVATITALVWGLVCYFEIATIPLSIIGGLLFFTIVLPFILHKIINRK